MIISFKLNDEQKKLDIDPAMPLLWVIRDELQLMGTKFGCGMAQCGACTVQLNGEAVRSCVLPVQAVASQSVTTIEGLSGRIHDVVANAWEEEAVYQCGYCQSGQLISAVSLLSKNNNPDDDAIDQYMSGNICRCATYVRIRKAIKKAAAKLRG